MLPEPITDDVKSETATIRLPAGTNERIDRMLYGGEVRSAFIRRAVLAELERREADAGRAQRA